MKKKSRVAKEINAEYNLCLELEEKASLVFSRDFRYEIRWLEENKPSKGNKEVFAGAQIEISEASKKDLKKVRNDLAKKLHPDKNIGNEEAADSFKVVQEAFENDDAASLLEIAEEYNIEVDVSSELKKAFYDALDEKLKYIRYVHEDTRCLWYKSERTLINRKSVWNRMGVKKEAFVPWLVVLGTTVPELQEECKKASMD